LRALLHASFKIGFVLESADGTPYPKAELSRFAAYATDLIADPGKKYCSNKDKERRKN
jgi:hypothetical protein